MSDRADFDPGTLRRTLAELPDPEPMPNPVIERGIADSVAYLGSDAAVRSIELDTYWPKWHSPWWHMLLLHELGEDAQRPLRAVCDRLALAGA